MHRNRHTTPKQQRETEDGKADTSQAALQQDDRDPRIPQQPRKCRKQKMGGLPPNNLTRGKVRITTNWLPEKTAQESQSRLPPNMDSIIMRSTK